MSNYFVSYCPIRYNFTYWVHLIPSDETALNSLFLYIGIVISALYNTLFYTYSDTLQRLYRLLNLRAIWAVIKYSSV